MVTGKECRLPGIFRFRSHMLPTVATEGARLVRVMLSLTLPSPLIFTVNGLPASATASHSSFTHYTLHQGEEWKLPLTCTVSQWKFYSQFTVKYSHVTRTVLDACLKGTGKTSSNLQDLRYGPDHTAHPQFQRAGQLGKTFAALNKGAKHSCLPGICSSANLVDTMYTPGTVGK